MFKLLGESDLKSNPLNFSNSEIEYSDFYGFYLPFTKYDGAFIYHVNLRIANGQESSFRRTRIRNSDFGHANLGGSDFWETDGINNDFSSAGMRDAKNLDYFIHLARNDFAYADMSQEDKELLAIRTAGSAEHVKNYEQVRQRGREMSR